MKIINDKVAKDMIDIMDDLNILYDVEVIENEMEKGKSM